MYFVILCLFYYAHVYIWLYWDNKVGENTATYRINVNKDNRWKIMSGTSPYLYVRGLV